jgi:hypothetical protein
MTDKSRRETSIQQHSAACAAAPTNDSSKLAVPSSFKEKKAGANAANEVSFEDTDSMFSQSQHKEQRQKEKHEKSVTFSDLIGTS